METWKTFTDECPEMARKVEARLRAHMHHVMATIRSDGSPRVSGTEVDMRGEHLYVGSMWQARKALDLRRDPRLAVHTNPGDGSMEGGDAKFSALATEVPDDDPAKVAIRSDQQPPEPFHFFRLDLQDVVLTEVDEAANQLHVHHWRPGWAIRTSVLK